MIESRNRSKGTGPAHAGRVSALRAGSSFGRFLGGFIYDFAGSYNPALIAAGVALVAAVLLVNRLGAYVYPVQPPVEPQFAPQPATT
jgi:predicted MFS family arabinose efflux permease